MERWVEHYSELYSRENIITDKALSVTECLPIMQELDAESTIGPLKKTLNCLFQERHQGKKASHQRLRSSALNPYSQDFMQSSASAGGRVKSHGTCNIKISVVRSLPGICFLHVLYLVFLLFYTIRWCCYRIRVNCIHI